MSPVAGAKDQVPFTPGPPEDAHALGVQSEYGLPKVILGAFGAVGSTLK